MFELSGVNYEEVLEQGDSILVELLRVRVIGGSSYRDYTVYVLFCFEQKSGIWQHEHCKNTLCNLDLRC